MLYLPNDDFFVNKFVYVELPTKAQIFSRTGQRAVSPSGSYTKDESANFGLNQTQQAESFAKAAESYESSNEE